MRHGRFRRAVDPGPRGVSWGAVPALAAPPCARGRFRLRGQRRAGHSPPASRADRRSFRCDSHARIFGESGTTASLPGRSSIRNLRGGRALARSGRHGCMRTGPRSTVRHRVPRPWDPDPRGLQPDVASVDPRPARGFIASPGMGGRGPGFHHRPATPPPRCLLSAGVRRGFVAGPANCGSGQHPDPAVRAPVRRSGSPDSAPAARRNRRVSRPADHGGCRHRASDRPAPAPPPASGDPHVRRAVPA